jgi:glycine hydroxymethyltransferase
MVMLQRRQWVPAGAENFIQSIAAQVAKAAADENERALMAFVDENRRIHERQCINLNPATNMMNPRAEALLASGIGSRPSLGYPGDKYEMGLEGIEKIEVMAAELAAEVFNARFVEIRVASGALANLYVFMAAAKPGDAIIAPPAAIGGHVTHHAAGAAGLYGLVTHPAPVDAGRFTVDVARLRELALRVKPKLITIGGSLNLFPHPIAGIRAIADEVGALVMFDAAHMSGMIAGRAWQQPLEEGAHVMTMSTYKSLGGPPSGLILSNDAAIAERLDAIAYPGLTANFDAAKSAALAMTLLDWKVHGRDYAKAMADTAKALAEALASEGVAVHGKAQGMTTSHQLAIEAADFGGGQKAAKRLRQANVLACGIGLPIADVDGDLNGLRLGVPEIVRWGMGPGHMAQVARFIADVLLERRSAQSVAPEVEAFREQFSTLTYIRDQPGAAP